MDKGSENELERRREVLGEKLLGALIEYVERTRTRPTVLSIALRLLSLQENINKFGDEIVAALKMMIEKVDFSNTRVPSFITKTINNFIQTYNDIIENVHSHLRKKDSYVEKFSTLEEIHEPTIEETIYILTTMQMNISQIVSYLVRWDSQM